MGIWVVGLELGGGGSWVFVGKEARFESKIAMYVAATKEKNCG